MNKYCKISPMAFGLSLGILWALSVVIISLLGMYFSYGLSVVSFLSSVYLGYELTVIGIIIGAGWSFLDGFIGGALIAFLYNLFVRH